VEIWLVAGESPRTRNGLIEAGVDSAVHRDAVQEAQCIGGTQLLDLAIFHQRIDELGPLITNLLERRSIGAVPLRRLGLASPGEPTLLEQDFLQLFRGVHVEFPASQRVQYLHQRRTPRTERSLQGFERATINRDTGVLHLCQHANQWQLGTEIQFIQLHSPQFTFEQWPNEHGYGRLACCSPLRGIKQGRIEVQLSRCRGSVAANSPV